MKSVLPPHAIKKRPTQIRFKGEDGELKTHYYVETGTSRRKGTESQPYSLYFDLDFSDVLATKPLTPEMKATKVFKNGKRIHNPSKAERIKSFLYSQDPKNLDPLIQEGQRLYREYCIPYFGEANCITNTGYGLHIHYWLQENFPQKDLQDLKKYYKDFILYIKGKEKFSFDPHCGDIGKRLTREIGSINKKGAKNRKVTCLHYNNRGFLDHKRLPTLPNFSGSSSSSAKTPKKRKRVPIELVGEDKITYEEKGKKITLTIHEFYNDYSNLEDSDGKVRVRLEKVSKNSLNGFTQKNGQRLSIFINAPKYCEEKEDHVLNGCGEWVYRGVPFELERDAKSGKVLQKSINIKKIILNSSQLKGNLRFNSRLAQIEIRGKASFKKTRAEWLKFGDLDYNNVLVPVVESFFDKSPTDNLIKKGLEQAATTLRVDPVKQWIEGLPFDPSKSTICEEWLPNVLGLDFTHKDYSIVSGYGRTVILSILRNIYIGETPPNVQTCLKLLGRQGVGKSFFAEKLGAVDFLGQQYFADQNVDLSMKTGDLMQILRGRFLMEFPEMASFSKKDVNTQKNFLTNKKMLGREAYGHFSKEELRSTYFILTGNDKISLSDKTGNRRYLILDLDVLLKKEQLDCNYLNSVLEQLYSAAYQRAILGQNIPPKRSKNTKIYEGKVCEDWNLSREETKIQEKINKNHILGDQVEDIIIEFFSDRELITTREVLETLKEVNLRPNDVRLSQTLSKLGYKKVRKEGGKRFWQKGETLPSVVPPSSISEEQEISSPSSSSEIEELKRQFTLLKDVILAQSQRITLLEREITSLKKGETITIEQEEQKTIEQEEQKTIEQEEEIMQLNLLQEEHSFKSLGIQSPHGDISMLYPEFPKEPQELEDAMRLCKIPKKRRNEILSLVFSFNASQRKTLDREEFSLEVIQEEFATVSPPQKKEKKGNEHLDKLFNL